MVHVRQTRATARQVGNDGSPRRAGVCRTHHPTWVSAGIEDRCTAEERVRTAVGVYLNHVVVPALHLTDVRCGGLRPGGSPIRSHKDAKVRA